MSAPPISSPFTKTCGIVGQPEISDSSWRIAGSGRTSTAVTGAPALAQRAQRTVGVAAHDELRRSLHEQRHRLVVDDVLDPFAQLVAHASLRLDSKLVDGAVAQRLGERLVDEPVLVEQREPVEAGLVTVTWKWSPPPVRSSTLNSGRVRERVLEQGLERLSRHDSRC